MADPSAVVAAHSAYDVLKDFQPAMAALVALTAAVIAYLGATAKVRDDRRARETDRLINRLSLALKLRAAARIAASEAGGALRVLSPDTSFGALKLLLPKSTPEFDEAWNAPTLIPIECLSSVETIRYIVRQSNALAVKGSSISAPQNPEEESLLAATNLKVLAMLRKNCEEIEEAAHRLRDVLDPEIERLRIVIHNRSPHADTSTASHEGVNPPR